jgi:hypothetical protein
MTTFGNLSSVLQLAVGTNALLYVYSQRPQLLNRLERLLQELQQAYPVEVSKPAFFFDAYMRGFRSGWDSTTTSWSVCSSCLSALLLLLAALRPNTPILDVYAIGLSLLLLGMTPYLAAMQYRSYAFKIKEEFRRRREGAPRGTAR